MAQQIIEVELESLLEKSRSRLFHDFVFEGGRRQLRRTRTSELLSNTLLVGGLLTGFALMGAVTGMLHRSGTATLASKLWLCGTFVLIAAQGLIAIGLTLKSTSAAAQNKRIINGFLQVQSRSAAALEVRGAGHALPPAPQPVALAAPVAPVGGRIGDRKFIRHPDSTIDVETLLGRRRFISLEAAQEFVGGTVIFDGAV